VGLRINQNIAAMNSYRNLTVTDNQLSKSLEKLSSGFRINKAADDAAGLSISEGLRSQVGGTRVAVRNAQDGISVVQTAEGALQEVHSILQRMRDLAVQASNTGSQDTNATAAAQTELSQLKAEIDRIGSTTSFGNTKLLDGTFGTSYVKAADTHDFDGTAFGAGTPGDVDITAGDDFTLSGVAGLPSMTVELAAGTYTTAASFATEVNRALRAALVTNGGTGSEVTFRVASTAGTVSTLEFVSGGAFTLADGNGTPLADLSGVWAGGAAASSGTGGVFQVGANNSSNDRISVAIGQISSTAGTLSTVNAVDVSTTAGAQSAISTLTTAISNISTTRATLGAYQNRFEHTIANLSVTMENLAASESRIRDTDMAEEMVSFTRSQILTQAGTAMLAQANQMPQGVLRLLG
jgi:flagellin